jgi:sulfur carrier protein
MKVELNGTPVELAQGATVATAVLEAGADAGNGRGVAVAVDGQVVPRGLWSKTRLESGQSVEVVRAVQGG